jgi:hypothetical protein
MLLTLGCKASISVQCCKRIHAVVLDTSKDIEGLHQYHEITNESFS